MTKKKSGRVALEALLERPWCYYCERDFDDVAVLVDHQRQKHFKCSCGRRLNTAGGLAVHMQQVHKETLTSVDAAIEGRARPDVEIFGMEGIPDDLLSTHRQNIMNEYFAMEGKRTAQTGNPPPGQGEPNSRKRKAQEETSEQRKARLAEHRAMRKAQREAAAQQGAAPGPAAGFADQSLLPPAQNASSAPNAQVAQNAPQYLPSQPTPHTQQPPPAQLPHLAMPQPYHATGYPPYSPMTPQSYNTPYQQAPSLLTQRPYAQPPQTLQYSQSAMVPPTNVNSNYQQPSTQAQGYPTYGTARQQSAPYSSPQARRSSSSGHGPQGLRRASTPQSYSGLQSGVGHTSSPRESSSLQPRRRSSTPRSDLHGLQGGVGRRLSEPGSPLDNPIWDSTIPRAPKSMRDPRDRRLSDPTFTPMPIRGNCNVPLGPSGSVTPSLQHNMLTQPAPLNGATPGRIDNRAQSGSENAAAPSPGNVMPTETSSMNPAALAPGHGTAPPPAQPGLEHAQAAPQSLPPRPRVAMPNVNRDDMQRMHTGQGAPAPAAQSLSATHVTGSSARRPHSGPFITDPEQRRRLASHIMEQEDLEYLRDHSNFEFLEMKEAQAARDQAALDQHARNQPNPQAQAAHQQAAMEQEAGNQPVPQDQAAIEQDARSQQVSQEQAANTATTQSMSANQASEATPSGDPIPAAEDQTTSAPADGGQPSKKKKKKQPVDSKMVYSDNEDSGEEKLEPWGKFDPPRSV